MLRRVVLLLLIGSFLPSPLPAQSQAAPADCLADLRSQRLYEIMADSVTYTVTNVPGNWGVRGRRAFFRGDSLVQDRELTRRLAETAWVKETIVDSTLAPFAYRPRGLQSPADVLESQRRTFRELWWRGIVQDAVIRFWTDTVLLTAAGLAPGPVASAIVSSITSAVPHVAYETLRSHITNLDNFMAGSAYLGVGRAIDEYRQLDRELERLRNAPLLNATQAHAMLVTYVRAREYELTNHRLLTAFIPKHLRDQFRRALRTIGSQALALMRAVPLIGWNELNAAHAVVSKLLLVDPAIRRMGITDEYERDIRYAKELIKDIEGWIDEWATTAVKLCSEASLSPSSQPQATITPRSGASGTRFVIAWTGFTPNNTLTSHLRRPDGTEFPARRFGTDSGGNAWTPIDSIGFAPGRYLHWAVDDQSAKQSAPVAFDVVPVRTAGPPPQTPVPPSPPPQTPAPAPGASSPAVAVWTLVSIGGALMNADITRPTILRAQLEFDGRVIATASSSSPAATATLSGQVLSVPRGPHTVAVRIVDQVGGVNTYETAAMQIQAFSGGTLATFSLGSVRSALATGQAISYMVDLR